MFQTGATVFPHFSVGLGVSDGNIIRRNLGFIGLHSLDYQSSERFRGDLSRFWVKCDQIQGDRAENMAVRNHCAICTKG